jgi:cyclin H
MVVEDSKQEEPEKEQSPEATESKSFVSNDDLYRRSTQYRLWSFITDDLETRRKQANEKGRSHATAKFKEAYIALKQTNPELFAQYGDTELSPSNLLLLIQPEEEAKFLRFYSNMIVKLSASFKMPTQVKATATSLFKKFYLVNSVMEYHPKMVLFTCLFLAAKSENYFISIEAFVKPLQKVEPKDILDLEFIVLQSLQFTLLVHHPFRPLYGFFLDFQAVLLHPSPVMYDVNIDTIGALYDKSKTWLNDNALLSDVAFLFTPPQIALAALYDCDRRITDKYLKRKFITDEKSDDIQPLPPKDNDSNHARAANGTDGVKQENEDDIVTTGENGIQSHSDDKPQDQDDAKKTSSTRDQYETIIRTIRRCIKVAKQVSEANRDESKEIDRKCYYCLHPKKLIEKKINKLKSPLRETTTQEAVESSVV